MIGENDFAGKGNLCGCGLFGYILVALLQYMKYFVLCSWLFPLYNLYAIVPLITILAPVDSKYSIAHPRLIC